MKNLSIIIGVVIAIVIGGLILWLVAGRTNNSPTASPTPGGTSSGTPSAPAAQEVKIKNSSFQPGTLTIKAGSRITFSNEDSTAHTVTATDKSFDSGNLKAGENFQKTFDTVGTFDYLCTLHPNMKGKIIVQ